MAGDIEIAGIRTRLADPKRALAELQTFARSRGGWGQLLDAAHVVGRDHLVAAHALAKRAFDRGTNATASMEMEFLLYASGERQISRAIEAAGVRKRRPFVLVVSGGVPADEVARTFGWTRDDALLRPTASKLRALGFTAKEVEASAGSAVDLALERTARVDLIK